MFVIMKNFLAKIIAFSFILSSSMAVAKIEVNVGAYDFKPYFVLNDNFSLTKISVDKLNQIQQKYHFKIVVVPAKRRYQSFNEGKIDLMIFEDQTWGWKKIPHYFSALPLMDGEVFFARKENNRDQNYFRSFDKKVVAGILGFHYALTNFEEMPDPKKLPFRFITFPNADNLISLVLKGRAEVGIVAKSYLNDYLKRNPLSAQQIIISEKYDHEYNLGYIVRPGSPIGLEEFGRYLKTVTQDAIFVKEARNIGINK